jgi:prepilin-type N-terminal cleavage/methylation domain-containing protein
MRSGSERDEAGFTLMEVLIATVVAGILLIGVTSGFVVALKGTTGVSDRFIESHDAQLLATYYPEDVQSTVPDSVDTNKTTPTGCASTPVGTTNVLRLQWTDVSTSTAYSVSYRYYSPAAGSWELRRYFCSRPGSTSTAPATYQVVAHDLADPAVNAPSVSQSPGAEISLTLYAAKASSESSSYSYTFTASMRTPGSPRFIVTAAGQQPGVVGPQVAGTTFNVTLTAAPVGSVVADTTYSGTKTIVFSGPDLSPNATPPVYPTSVTFTNGVGTAPVTLYNAKSTTLTAADGDRSGSTTSAFTVAPAPVPLSFSPCPPATTTTATTVETITRGQDPYGNADPNSGSAVTVNLSAAGGSIQPQTVTIAANQTTSTPVAMYTNPTTSGTSVTLAGTGAGYASASCNFTTTGPMFLINSVSPQAAGGAFSVSLTASNDGSTADATYSGPKTVTFSGPANSPNGQAPPSYPATVNFISGVGTATITLFDAQTVTLSATDGPHTGSVSVTVLPAIPLTFPACASINTTGRANNTETVTRATNDAYGNTDPNAVSVALTATDANGNSVGTFSLNSATITSMTINAGQTASGSFTYTNPSKNIQVTLTGQVPGYGTTTCQFTTS